MSLAETWESKSLLLLSVVVVIPVTMTTFSVSESLVLVSQGPAGVGIRKEARVDAKGTRGSSLLFALNLFAYKDTQLV